MKKLHIAISTNKMEETVKDYSIRLDMEPCFFISNEYALWRTDALNVSVRQDPTCTPGELRHLGWEDDSAPNFSKEEDVNGITWERFSAQQQANEINDLLELSTKVKVLINQCDAKRTYYLNDIQDKVN
ncbi:MAG: hypothetical protein Q9M19_01630 [Mariprofundaceae bacterium]|nr:hypothetical protein [Mariprofundaceae bacterium]